MLQKNSNKVNSCPCFLEQQFGVKQVSSVYPTKISVSQNSNTQFQKTDINLLNLNLEKAIKLNYDWPLHCR